VLRFNPGKYRTLTAAVALFLIMQAGLFALDLVVSAQIRKDATYERLASRQTLLLQIIYEAALHVGEGALPEGLREEQTALLDKMATNFDRTLTAFTQGGNAIGKRDGEVSIEAIATPQAQAILLEAKAIWSPLVETIHGVTRQAAPSETDTRELSLRVVEAQPDLLRLMTRLAALMDEIAEKNLATLNLAKVVTLVLAALNFLLILFYLIAHLRRNDQELERARKETEDILRTTQEGLFLLDPQYLIGTQHSRVLERIIGTADFAGANFFSLLQPMVTEKTLVTAREYLDLLFKHDVKEKLVTDLNPLNCVQILYRQGPGNPETRYLEFGFNRVKAAGKITHLLVTVNDVTQRINLERSLKETEARTRDQISMLIEILQIEPAALQQFMRTARTGLHNMNDLLQKQETGLDARGSKVHALFRQTHRIKGDAAGLGLQNIAASFERLEDTLTGMHERHNLTGEDFLPITVQVKALYEQIEAIELLIGQISQARGIVTIESPRMPQEAGTDQLAFVQRWRSFATEIAARQGNAVEVNYTGLDIGSLPNDLQDAVTTLVNQFIRNAVVHGIETPETRQRLNKPAAGRLSIYVSRRDDGGIDLGFRDDGRGISVERIRQAAIEKGRLTPETAATLEPRRIIGLIFEPGMSTRQTVDGDAGRGAGLDAVREIVTRMGGNIRLGTTVNEYCHFRISLAPPAAGNATEGAAA
jgi:HPt (histidine-containing phosphotransfer) domain-containing protein/PAS domain-containing protein